MRDSNYSTLSKRFQLRLVLDLSKLEKPSADGGLISHYNALANAQDVVFFALNSAVVQMVCRHFETGKHQSAWLHFADAKSSNSQNLALECHFIS